MKEVTRKQVAKTSSNNYMAEAPQQIQIRIPDDVIRGHYANIMRANTTPEEFILDFGTLNPIDGQGLITSRIFMNPGHVKRMIEVLKNVMEIYEKQHGAVDAAVTPKEIGFKV